MYNRHGEGDLLLKIGISAMFTSDIEHVSALTSLPIRTCRFQNSHVKNDVTKLYDWSACPPDFQIEKIITSSAAH